jgi:hypothetical protein
MLRPDLSKAISQAPPDVGKAITTSCATSLELLNAHLPADETVVNISSASPEKDGKINSVLALTDRRLIFVAPAPQALGWRLSTITRAQSYIGYFFVHANGGEYSVGLEGEWGSVFEGYVKEAIAQAVLADH